MEKPMSHRFNPTSSRESIPIPAARASLPPGATQPAAPSSPKLTPPRLGRLKKIPNMEKPMSHRFNPTSLREYDIRGVVGETLGPDDAEAVGRTFGTFVRRAAGHRVAVGRDGRDSSPELEARLVEGLTK